MANITLNDQIKHVKSVIQRQKNFLASCRDKKKFEQCQKERDIMQAVLWTLEFVRDDINKKKDESNE